MTASALSAWRWLCVFLPARAALSRATGSPPSFPMALCMTGLRVYRHLRTRSPDKARQAPPPGNSAQCCFRLSSRWRCADRLRVHHHLRTGSPDKARQAPPPGNSAQCCFRLSSRWRCADRLRVHHHLRTGSPDKARNAASDYLPCGAALNRTTDLPPSADGV